MKKHKPTIDPRSFLDILYTLFYKPNIKTMRSVIKIDGGPIMAATCDLLSFLYVHVSYEIGWGIKREECC